jgi:hypothetical protein
MATVAAAAALPGAASVPSAMPKPALLAAVAEDLSDPHDLGIFVPGCGSACDCCWYLRADRAWGRTVRKLGDKFIIYDHDNNVIGEADPGFKPLPHDAEWITKVEFARAHDIPHPYDWPAEAHEAWT